MSEKSAQRWLSGCGTQKAKIEFEAAKGTKTVDEIT